MKHLVKIFGAQKIAPKLILSTEFNIRQDANIEELDK
jgi:hypothetical protein